MKFGISLPNFGVFGDLDLLRDLAKEAEDCGWDGFFLWDHINCPTVAMLDPWIALAAVARDRAHPHRHDGDAAGAPTAVDRRTAGRDARSSVGWATDLGVGLGFPPDREFAALGEDPDDRVRAEKLDESLAIIDGLWTGEPFSFAGKCYTIEETVFLPRPVQQPRIPVWVAGMWPSRAPMRRAARWDGAFPIKADLGFLSADEVRDIGGYISAHRAGAAPFDLVIGRDLAADDARARDEVAAFEAAGVTWWMESDQTPDEVRAKLKRSPIYVR